MDDARAQAKEKMAALIERVMADGKIEPEEREEMQSFFAQALMTLGDVRDVLADGHVTDEERARCRAIVTELKIPPSLWPGEIRAIVS
jgi:uncharacterized tellurite resistance protein B-like protein